MLSLKQVCKAFQDKLVLSNISFEVGDSEVIGLVGPSGSGKSVLLKVLGQVLKPDYGSIVHIPAKMEEGKGAVGFLFQESALFDSMTVLENVAFPLRAQRRETGNTLFAEHAYSEKEAMERARDILVEVGLSAARNKLPGQLSGGMRRRVGIARALVSKPDLLLLDDPTGGLDPVAASVIMNLIRKLYQHYQPTILMVSHDLRRLIPNVDRIIGLNEGRIWCDQKTSVLPHQVSSDVLKFLSARYDFSAGHVEEHCQ